MAPQLQAKVSCNMNKLGVTSLGVSVEVAVDRTVEGVRWSLPPIPNTPLEIFLRDRENEVFVKKFEAAVKETQLFISLLWGAKDADDKVKFAELLNIETTEEDPDKEYYEEDLDKTADIPKPDVPVMDQNSDEAALYHPRLLKALLAKQTGKRGPFRLFASKDGEDERPNKLATKIDVYDDVAEEILPRNRPKVGGTIYRGRGTGGKGTADKLRIVQAYLLDQFNIPYNSFAKEIKPNHRDVEISEFYR